MSALSDIASGLAAAVCSFTIVSAAGCGTDAKGIDDCRNIEEARCEAAKNCGIPGLTDVDGCRRFYRDQCLHGLPVDSPGSPAVAGCVAVIRAAGSCATSPDIELMSCSPALSEDPPLTKACDVVISPELTHECAFLAPSAATGGAAGSAGTAGSSGSGGDAGSGGTGGGAGAGTAGAAGAAG